MPTRSTLLCAALALALAACNDATENKTSPTTMEPQKDSSQTNPAEAAANAPGTATTTAGGVTMKNYVAYDQGKAGPRPVVLVVPEWWGLTDYPRKRADSLAKLGYFALAVDVYGDGKVAADPKEAQELATPFYQNPQLAKERLDAALAQAKTYAQADTAKAVAIGYCFGGSMVINYAKMGAPVKGVVSFHGGLQTVPPQKGTAAQFLICHGGADGFVPAKEVAAFRKGMDSAGVAYTFKTYANATHAFTNPDATANGKKFNMPIAYNGAADTASWNDMKAFFGSVLR